MLELRNIQVGFPGKVLFTTGSISLSQGLHILIGANGSGKTSFLRSILAAESDGFILDSRELNTFRPEERARKIAYISSSFSGLSYLRLQEYLELGRYPHTGKSGRLTKEDREILQLYSTRFNLDHLLQRFTSTLSDGERQRGSIARGFIQQTPLVLLDEPTSFLDYPFKRSILQQLRSAADDEGKIVIISSHDLEIAFHYATSFLVVNPLTSQLVHVEPTIDFNSLLRIAFPELSRP